MTPISDYDVARAMVTHGGSFVSALGQAWARADQTNGDKIKAAFAEYWTEYRDLAERKAARERDAQP